MALIVPDEVHTLAVRAEEHADRLYREQPEVPTDDPAHDEKTWRQGYEVGFARAVQQMSRWALGDGAADTLRELADRLDIDL